MLSKNKEIFDIGSTWGSKNITHFQKNATQNKLNVLLFTKKRLNSPSYDISVFMIDYYFYTFRRWRTFKKKRKKYLLPVIWSSRNHFFMTKLSQNDFSRGRPGPTGSEISIIGLATLRQIFFIFDLNWESLRKRVISEKRLIFTKTCFSKVRFFTLPCALLELLLKLKQFSTKLRTLFEAEKK